MAEALPVAKSKTSQIALLPALANRHGLIAGATGTGKTVTMGPLLLGRDVVRGVLGSILGSGRKRR